MWKGTYGVTARAKGLVGRFSSLPVVRKMILATLTSELCETRRRINALINDTPYLRERRDLLESIPGIGPAASAYLLVALSDHYAFAHAKQAVAYAGLAPKLQESGQMGRENPAIEPCAKPCTCQPWSHGNTTP